MSLYPELAQRSENKCELCTATNDLTEYVVSPKSDENKSDMVVVCPTCLAQIVDPALMDTNHWRCLNESIWSPVPAVQVVSYRQLQRLSGESWAQDLLGMMYMDEPTTEWAKHGTGTGNESIVHKDSNGNVLTAGDTVTLIKDLNVKGANFTAKRGTAVRRISLVHDNPEHIEGKVDGQHIVILTKFVKKN